MLNFQSRPRTKSSLLVLLLFVGTFGAIGTKEILNSRAAEPVTLSGYMFEDANRNGAYDAGEKPMTSKAVYFCDNIAKTNCTLAVTDSNGYYTKTNLVPSNYTVQLEPSTWWEIYDDWTPTTTGKLVPEFTQDISTSKTYNFGFRPIYYSADESNINTSPPVTTYTPPSGGPIVKVYNDAISAQDVYNRLVSGSLISKEALTTTIEYGARNSINVNYFAWSGSEENCINSDVATHSTLRVNFRDSFGEGGGTATSDNALFHEYGHSWSRHWACVHGDPYFTEYLAVRGLTNDARLGTSHAWSKLEMIAEDYRQLFGDATAAAGPQENREITPARDVAGLKDYLMTTFMTPKGNISPTAPGNLTASVASGAEGASVQLNWTASTDNTGVKSYLIYRDNQFIDAVNDPSTTYADITLKFNTTYKYYVVATDQYNNKSPSSNIVTITTPPSSITPPPQPDTTAPTAPTNLTTTTITTTSVGLQWSAATDNIGVTGYRVYRIDSARKSSPILMAVIPGTSYNAAGLKKGTTYSFYVQAIDAAGNISTKSPTLTAKTKTR